LIGATLLGDTRKVAFLTQAFDRGAPLPQERIKLLVDLSDGAEMGDGRGSHLDVAARAGGVAASITSG
ncbi:hypothetical protein, partial [Modestobacter versicolor]|uniref:hypothetical protein n=1 Tax=Modestobacter versicolor TaxID=429133 RepID=UPI0015E8D516